MEDVSRENRVINFTKSEWLAFLKTHRLGVVASSLSLWPSQEYLQRYFFGDKTYKQIKMLQNLTGTQRREHELRMEEKIFKRDVEVCLVYQMKRRKGTLNKKNNTLKRKQGVSDMALAGRWGGSGAGKCGQEIRPVMLAGPSCEETCYQTGTSFRKEAIEELLAAWCCNQVLNDFCVISRSAAIAPLL